MIFSVVVFLSETDGSVDLFKVRDKFSKIEVDYKGFKSSLSDLEKFIKELENMAKELGVQPSSLDGYNEAKGRVRH